MVSTELSAAVLVADVVLYGFMIAYYVLALGLRDAEKARAFRRPDAPTGAGLGGEGRDAAARKADEAFVNASAGAASGDLFLLGCTLFAVPSAFLGILGLLGSDIAGLGSVVLFAVFLLVVAVGLVGVAVQDFRKNLREAREKVGADTPTMDILNRGLGRP